VTNQGLTARPAFSDVTEVMSSGLMISVRENLTLVSFCAPKGKRAALIAAVKDAYGVELPATPARVEGKDIAFVWNGPEQWLAVAERGNGRDLERQLKPVLAGLSSVVDLSDARVAVRISGPRARDVLAKGVPIDLHPRAFRPGMVAISHASHMSVILWQLDGAPTYELAVFRSFAASFAHWLQQSAAEYISF
jgi:heterotetrameric sarcosine oxidase gamma subunit